jgi:ATP-binding cassette subfamily B protein
MKAFFTTLGKDYEFIRPYLERRRGRIGLGVLALTAKSALGAAWPLLVRNGVDAIRSEAPLTSIYWFSAAMVSLAAGKGIFQYWMRLILVNISRDLEYDLRNDLMAKLVALSPEFYAKHRTGDLMARATSDLNAIRMMFGVAMMYQAETTLLVSFAAAAMLSTDWVLSLCCLLAAPLITFTVIHFGTKIHQNYAKIQGTFGEISNLAQESIAGARVLRAYGQEEAEILRFKEINDVFIGKNMAMVRAVGMYYPTLDALSSLNLLIVLWAGSARVFLGKITPGDFVMFMGYLSMMTWPLIAFGWVTTLVQRGRASLGRIRPILEEQPLIQAPPHPVKLPEPVRGAIRFEGVTLAYGDHRALDGVDLEIEAGATVAIVGATGSGKSSLLQLIPRLKDPTGGRVLLDGVDLRELDPRELRRAIGFVPQETFLFGMSLRDNIAFGAPEATLEQVRGAAEQAGLASDIEGFPQGYETMLGERGITLSGGQKQRTAIARALLRDPRILILDDALSSVDTVTEDRILHALSTYRRGRTTILVSHRVSTVRDADRIFVLEQGRVAEQGTHAELLELGGYYADLHRKQLLEEELEHAG